MVPEDYRKLLITAVYAGEIMLKNGAETYRVEDTINRICKSRSFHQIEAFVTPTGIFVSLGDEDHLNDLVTYVKRIKTRAINLNKVSKVNDFSRRFVESEMSLDEAIKSLKEIDKESPYPIFAQSLFGGIASGFFALLFGASIYEFAGALVASILVTSALHFLRKLGFYLFITHIVGGTIAALTAIIANSIFPFIQIDMIIIGAIMVMVPGVAMTNAVRDSIAGDLVSGLARGTEALLIAISIAFGVGFVLQVWMILRGLS